MAIAGYEKIVISIDENIDKSSKALSKSKAKEKIHFAPFQKALVCAKNAKNEKHA